MAIRTASSNKPQPGTVVRAGDSSGRLPNPASPTDLLWEDADPYYTQRSATVQIFGETDTGRSTLALTAPGPIAYLHTLEKAKAVAAPFARAGKVIRFLNFGGAFKGTPEEVELAAMDRVRYFKKAWWAAFEWARTIIVDTDTDAWMLYRLAYFGMMKPTSGRIDANWGPVNADWLSTLKLARAHNETHNVIFVSQGQDEYSDKAAAPTADPTKKKGLKTGGDSGGMGKKTGRIVADCQKKVPFLCDVRLRTFRDGGSFKVEIIKALANEDLHGMEVENPMNTFGEIMGLVTESDSSEWEV